MGIFLVGLVLFLGIHTVSIVAPRWRGEQVARLGEMPWKGLYAVIAAVGLVLLVYGYGMARQAPLVLYTPPTGLRHVALLLMVPVFPLLVAAYVPGRISAAAKHPMLLATKIWATAHLLANGTLPDVLLFGGFLAWAVADRISLKRRPPERKPGAPARPYNDVIVVVVGLVVYAVFVLRLHQWLFGVSPLPSLK
ncbi:MAG: NnrU family protein [Caldimonas sp.]